MNINERLDHLDRRLLNDFHAGIPLPSRPCANMAEQLGLSEREAIARRS
jgi:DNA-binding Lrp family transcriptional regulator